MVDLIKELGIPFTLYHQIKNVIIFFFGCGAMWLFMKGREFFKVYKFAFNDLGAGYQMALKIIKDKDSREHLISILNSNKHAYLPVIFKLFVKHLKHENIKPEEVVIKYSKELQIWHYAYLLASLLVIVLTLCLIFVIQGGS